MGCLLECLLFKKGHDRVNKNDIPNSIWDLGLLDINGNATTLQEYKKNNKLFIFVNVACK